MPISDDALLIAAAIISSQGVEAKIAVQEANKIVDLVLAKRELWDSQYRYSQHNIKKEKKKDA